MFSLDTNLDLAMSNVALHGRRKAPPPQETTYWMELSDDVRLGQFACVSRVSNILEVLSSIPPSLLP